jgi:hypothetical protein
MIPAEDFMSGDAGDVTHPWRRAKRAGGELIFEAIDRLTGVHRTADRLAAAAPSRRVLVTGIYRPGQTLSLDPLRSVHHEVRFALGATGATEPSLAQETVTERLEGGKFENLNRVLAATAGTATGAPGAEAAAAAFDWLLVVDDDIRLPARFLDRFIGICERFGLDLAQPAQSQRSHSAWRVTRRRPASLVRETRFVEIGPLTAFGSRAAGELLPFPELRFGWGLDLHWAAVAAERGWRLGVVDVTPVRHEAATVGSAYPAADARTEAAAFLTDRPYLPATHAGDVLATHRRS